MSFQTGQKLSYQRMLRAIGSFLDQERPDEFTVLEVPDGFSVVMGRGKGDSKLEEVHFTRATLADKAEQLMRGRRPSLRERQNNWGLSPSGYEDFLRALGFELDDSQAYGILIDDMNGNLL